MPVKKEPSGRRSIQVEIEVPGTPEDVWKAIATGPGISAWFVPTQLEERDGKPVTAKMDFGSGMELEAAVKVWEPLRKWAGEAQGMAPGAPPIASEWSIEARAGGTCIVRIVQSLFASTDDWDNQLEGAEYGWPGFLRTLRLYLAHFRGQGSAPMKWMAPVPGTEAQAWDALTAAMGLRGASVGQGWTPPADVPASHGVVEYISQSPYDALLRIDQPGPGIVALGALNFGGQSLIAVGFYLYGDAANETVAREKPLWEAWIQKRFPMPASAE